MVYWRSIHFLFGVWFISVVASLISEDVMKMFMLEPRAMLVVGEVGPPSQIKTQCPLSHCHHNSWVVRERVHIMCERGSLPESFIRLEIQIAGAHPTSEEAKLEP